MPVAVRPIRVEDAQKYLQFQRQMDVETSYMMLEPGERTTGVDNLAEEIRSILRSENKLIFVAETEHGELVGSLGAEGGRYRRNHYTVSIYIGILQAFAGQGIGRCLFAAMEEWARSWGARRLELTVMAHNSRALALYEKVGFVIEGLRRDSLKVDGQFVDEYAMSKIL